MNGASIERVQISRQRRYQRLAFAGAHLGDLAFVQRDAAHQLHVVGAFATSPARCLAYGGKGFRQQRIQGRAIVQTLLELGGSGGEFLGAKRLHGRLKRANALDNAPHALQLAGISRAEDLANNAGNHLGALGSTNRPSILLLARPNANRRSAIAVVGNRPSFVRRWHSYLATSRQPFAFAIAERDLAIDSARRSLPPSRPPSQADVEQREQQVRRPEPQREPDVGHNCEAGNGKREEGDNKPPENRLGHPLKPEVGLVVETGKTFDQVHS